MGYMKFINDNAVIAIFGKSFPMDIKRLAKTLDQYLNYLCDEGYTLPMDLLMHNVSPKRDVRISEFAKIDIDFVIRENLETKKINIHLNNYRASGQGGRPDHDQRVVLHIIVKNKTNTTWAVHVPLQAVMLGFGDPFDGYQCYGHFITFLGDDGMPNDQPEVFYCGITRRNWITRMTEHFRESKKGSRKKFHRLWREYQGNENVLLNSELLALNHTEAGAMKWEEWIVDKHIAENASLNTIAGGFKGLEQIGQFKLPEGAREGMKLCRGFQVTYFGNESRKGLPNPYMQKLWQDDEHYARVINNRENTFSKEEVELIRSLAAKGHDAASIGKQLGVSNMKRLNNIIDGKTYRRM